MKPIIEIEKVTFSYPRFTNKSSQNVILNNISVEIFDSEIFCIVGESGSGKTTLAKLIAKLHKPSNGTIKYKAELINSKNSVQILFQNSDELLNPRRKVLDVLRDVKTSDHFFKTTLNELNISENLLDKQCSVISGGERQRVALARILLTQPKILILDEPFSAQDYESKENFKTFLDYKNLHSDMTLIVITHDIALIKDFADRIIVLFGGAIVELAEMKEFLKFPKHPYSNYLLDAAKLDLKIKTDYSFPGNSETRCPYYTRCDRREEVCNIEVVLKESKNGFVFCNRPYTEAK
ncbi:MAG: ATP-binding cassette domain-containing protein [Melioribacteraceae bacterium]